jgi:uncharacterized protein
VADVAEAAAAADMKDLPKLGVGLGFREEMRSEIFLNRQQIDFLEITSDHYLDALGRKREELEILAEHFTLIPHSLDLSLGSAEGIDDRYVDKLAELIDRVRPPWFSDHICFTRSGGINIGHLAPLPFTQEALETLVRNINRMKKRIDVPLVLENITYNVRMPSAEMSEGEFIRRVLEETNSGMLLDVTNLYINSINLGFDWRKFLDDLPLERVVQLHFVGSRSVSGRLIDAHSDPTEDEIWNVFREACVRCDIKGAILERDGNYPEFSEILTEIEIARAMVTNPILLNDVLS